MAATGQERSFNTLSVIKVVEICRNLGGSHVLRVSKLMEMDEFAHQWT